ncbi:uncharacterized protein [Arachis hypogaea]|uniref:uncharacterized protein isoform X1 n=1 Tax=Arachis hypogaea TaxID=3818 RepID=UPI003B216E3F
MWIFCLRSLMIWLKSVILAPLTGGLKLQFACNVPASAALATASARQFPFLRVQVIPFSVSDNHSYCPRSGLLPKSCINICFQPVCRRGSPFHQTQHVSFYSPWSTFICSSSFLLAFKVQDEGVWSCIGDHQTLWISPHVEDRFAHCDHIQHLLCQHPAHQLLICLSMLSLRFFQIQDVPFHGCIF